METPGGPSVAEPVVESSVLEYDDAFLKELGFDIEGREKALNTLENMFGGRVFHYGDYSGTVRDMYDSCPAFGDILEQGAPAAAAWLEANDQPQRETKPATPEQPTETAQENSIEQAAKPVRQPDDTPRRETEATPDSRVTAPSKTTAETPVSDATAPVIQHVESSHPEVTPSPPDTNNTDTQTSVGTAESVNDTPPQVKRVNGDENQPLTTIAPEKYDPVNEEISKPGVVKNTPTESVELPAIATDTISEKESQSDKDLTPDAPTSSEALTAEGIDTSTEALEMTNEPDETEPRDELSRGSIEDTLENFEEATALAIDSDTESTYEVTADEHEFIADHSDADPILGVMMNEMKGPENDEASESLGIIEEDPQPQVLAAETLELLSEFIPETPELDIEVPLVELSHQATATIEIIEVLEKANTAEECREALGYVRVELAHLLELLGYNNPDAIADRLVKQYGMLSIKQYIILLTNSLAQSPETVSSTAAQAVSSLSPRHYGTHAVRSVVNLALGTLELQVA